MLVKQKTLKEEISIKGVGLHTGEMVNLTIKPAPENHGYRFCRVDSDEKIIIRADIDNVISTERGTTLESSGQRVHTTEHLLASLYGMEIDNALIELDGPEIPIMDGSAMQFVEAIKAVGIQDQRIDKEYLELKNNMKYEHVERRAEVLVVPDDEFRLTVMVDYNSPILGTQHASMYNISEFVEHFSPCRTFVFLREVEALYKKGLIKGGDVDNAIVMVDQKMSDEKLSELRTLFNKPEIEVQGIGMLNNVSLRFDNEPARHKLLDIIGDIALVGAPIKAHILAARPGHFTNIEFAKELKKKIRKGRNAAPDFDLSKTVLDTQQIQKLLPHRYPMLLVDRIIELSDSHVVGIKNVTATESHFLGHFPNEPVMPGVLIMEALAQTGGVMAMGSVSDPSGYRTYFLKMDKVKFKQKVIPGDTLIMKMELISPIRHGVVIMKGSAYVQDRLVAEGILTAQFVKERQDESSIYTS